MCGARFDCTVCLQSRSADLQQLSRSVTDVEKRRPEIALPDSFCVIPSFRWRCLDRRRTARADGFALSIESSNVCYRSVSALMRSAAGAIKIDRLRSGDGQSSREIFARITGLRKRVCRTGQPNEKKGGSTTSGRSTSAEDPNSAKVIPPRGLNVRLGDRRPQAVTQKRPWPWSAELTEPPLLPVRAAGLNS